MEERRKERAGIKQTPTAEEEESRNCSLDAQQEPETKEMWMNGRMDCEWIYGGWMENNREMEIDGWKIEMNQMMDRCLDKHGRLAVRIGGNNSSSASYVSTEVSWDSKHYHEPHTSLHVGENKLNIACINVCSECNYMLLPQRLVDNQATCS